METMKKFRTYLLIFLVGVLIVELFTNFIMKIRFIDITKHEINVTSPKVVITESKASYTKGYIKGNITNDTGEHIKDKYLQFDFYDKDGIYVGTESKEIKYFNVEEKINFDINYECRNVDTIEIRLVDEVIKPEDNRPSFNSIKMEDGEKQLAIALAICIGVYAILP